MREFSLSCHFLLDHFPPSSKLFILLHSCAFDLHLGPLPIVNCFAFHFSILSQTRYVVKIEQSHKFGILILAKSFEKLE